MEHPRAEAAVREILPHSKTVEGYEVTRDFEGIGTRTLLLNARRLDHQQLILLAIEDISGRSRVEAALRESERRYRLLVERAREYAIFTLDPKGHVTSWNQGAEHLFGYTAEEIIGQPDDIVFTEEDRAAGVPERERAVAAETGQTLDERLYVRKDGTRFWASGVLEALHGEGEGFSKVLRDNTERRQAEEALRQANVTLEQQVRERTGEVRRLANELSLAESRERNRIAQTVHDGLQQQLHALQFPLAHLKKVLEDEQALETLEDLNSTIRDAIYMGRNITSDLSPPVLRGEGLVEALSWLATSMKERFGLTVKLQVDDGLGVPDEAMRTLLFSLVRELLFNVTKHANAS